MQTEQITVWIRFIATFEERLYACFFEVTGKISVDMQLFIITDIDFDIKSLHNFNMLGLIPSSPVALLLSIFSIICLTSSTVMNCMSK